MQLRRVRTQVRARQGSGHGVHGEGHPRGRHRGQDGDARVGRRGSAAGRHPARALPRRSSSAQGIDPCPRRAVRLLQGESREEVTLRRVGATAVPRGSKPGFDHADVYTKNSASRMYVAHTGADRVDVFDCAGAKYLHALEGHPGVAGVLIDSDHNVMLTTDRGSARLSYFRVSDETLIAQVAVGQRPNGVAFDTRQTRAYTFDLGD